MCFPKGQRDALFSWKEEKKKEASINMLCHAEAIKRDATVFSWFSLGSWWLFLAVYWMWCKQERRPCVYTVCLSINTSVCLFVSGAPLNSKPFCNPSVQESGEKTPKLPLVINLSLPALLGKVILSCKIFSSSLTFSLSISPFLLFLSSLSALSFTL